MGNRNETYGYVEITTVANGYKVSIGERNNMCAITSSVFVFADFESLTRWLQVRLNLPPHLEDAK